jgi:hypothetical protein
VSGSPLSVGSRALATTLVKQLVPLRQKLIDLGDEFTGMFKAFRNLLQQLFLFVFRHFHVKCRRQFTAIRFLC